MICLSVYLSLGNELPSELLETLLKMAPTPEEELKLRLYNGEISQLGPAERFLKALVDVPFAFRRLKTLLFMGTLQEEATSVKESFIILEVGIAKYSVGVFIPSQMLILLFVSFFLYI